MEHVVYILGAGFSAPHGLPVMSNFIEKSKDLYTKDEQKYQHFSDIYQLFDKISNVLKFIGLKVVFSCYF